MPELELTSAQRDAIESTGESVAVIAGAGSGKTLVLIERLRRIISEPSGGLDRILAITFTEKAAAELKTKLRRHLKPEFLPRLASAWIGTFHSFSARVLRANAPAAGLDPSFRILDENGARLLARRSVEESFLDLLNRGSESAALLVEELEYKNALGVMENLMSFRWHAERLFEMPPPGEEREAALICAASDCFAAAKAEFEARIRQINSLDFQEIEIATLTLFRDSPDILSAYQKKFRHILVDEYQDTNDIQTELVKLLFKPALNRLFIVGDPRQSIYRFRGANVGCFSRMQEQIIGSGGRAITLAENFRSRPAIIDFVNRAAGPLEKSLFENGAERSLRAHRCGTDFPSVTALACASGDDSNADELRRFEAEAIASHIERLVEGKEASYGDIVCLFQAITAIQYYEAAFRRHKIPCRVYGGRQLLDRPEIADLVAALNFAANPDNDTALITLIRSPLIGISDDECALLAGDDGSGFKKAVRSHPRARLLALLEKAGVHRRPSEILRLVLDETGYEVFSAAADPSGGRVSNIDRLLTLAESLERESPVSLSAFVDFAAALRKENARLGDPPAASEAGKLVRCMTVHAAKGLEFPIVFLPDLVRQPSNRGGSWIFARGEGLGFKWRDMDAPFGPTIPSESYTAILDRDKSEEENESLRLLYVAMTRARERLIIPVHEKDKPAWRWHRWLKPLTSDENVETICMLRPAEGKKQIETPPDAGYSVRLAKAHSAARLPRTFTVSELESFDRCPQEYYLKYVAQIPAGTILAKRQDQIPADVRGSIIHGAIEKMIPGENDDVLRLVREQCLFHQIIPTAGAINKLSKPVENFKKDPLFSRLATGKRELEFHLSLGANTIRGKIDWLRGTSNNRPSAALPANSRSSRTPPVREGTSFAGRLASGQFLEAPEKEVFRGTPRESGDGFEIIDFKTDRIAKNEVARRAGGYRLQMTAYALAAEAGGSRPVQRTVLYFLDIGLSHTEPVNETRLKQGANRIESIIARINSRDYELSDFVPPCAEADSRCPYHLNGLCWLDRGRTI